MPVVNVRRHPHDLAADEAVLHHAVRRLKEAVVVNAGVNRHRTDEADVGAFRRLNRADASVVRFVNVAHFQFRRLPRQSAGAEGRQAALGGQFRQRVGLIHELRELRRAEERLNRRRNWFDRQNHLRDDIVVVQRGHALFGDFFHAEKAHAQLRAQQFADGADALVFQVVNVVGHKVAGAGVQVDDIAQDADQIFLC